MSEPKPPADRVEEIRREHAPTPGDDHCACDVRYGIGCWVGDLLTAYDDMRAKYLQQHKAWVTATTLLEAAQRRLAADELTQEAEKLGMYNAKEERNG